MTAIETTGRELTAELLDLMQYEKAIEQGVAMIGWNLLQIRDGRKYQAAGFSSFEDYCQERWGMGRNYANRQIAAATTVKQIEEVVPIGTTLPTHESQVRPLVSIARKDPVEAASTWNEAVERAGGELPTAKQVDEVVRERRIPQAVPKPLPKPVAPVADESTIKPHPATFPAAVLAIFDDIIPGGSTVLDPFGGVGGIHALTGCETFAIELEEEWAQIDPRTTLGDARNIAELFPDRQFDAIATSPAYGNRLADAHYNASDPEARRTYALDLGRPLTEGNGAGLHFDTNGAYEELHEQVWRACIAALRPGGLFLLNCKDFQRDGRIMPVIGWHVGTLAKLGLRIIDLRTLPVGGLPSTTAAKLSELVVVFKKRSWTIKHESVIAGTLIEDRIETIIASHTAEPKPEPVEDDMFAEPAPAEPIVEGVGGPTLIFGEPVRPEWATTPPWPTYSGHVMHRLLRRIGEITDADLLRHVMAYEAAHTRPETAEVASAVVHRFAAIGG